MLAVHPKLQNHDALACLPDSVLRFILIFFDRNNRQELGPDHNKAVQQVMEYCGLSDNPMEAKAGSDEREAITTFLILQSNYEYAELTILTQHYYNIIADCSEPITTADLAVKEKTYEIRNKNLTQLPKIADRIRELEAILFPTEESAALIASQETLRRRSRMTPEGRTNGA